MQCASFLLVKKRSMFHSSAGVAKLQHFCLFASMNCVIEAMPHGCWGTILAHRVALAVQIFRTELLQPRVKGRVASRSSRLLAHPSGHKEKHGSLRISPKVGTNKNAHTRFEQL